MDLSYYVLLVLSSLSKGTLVKGEYITKEINNRFTMVPYTQRDITGRLRSLHKLELIKKHTDTNIQLVNRYPVAYWSITELGRQTFKKGGAESK